MDGWAKLGETLAGRSAEMADVQASAVFWESTCGCVVYKHELWQLRRNGEYRELTSADALRRCANRTSSPFELGKFMG